MKEDLKNIFKVVGFDKIDNGISNDLDKIIKWQCILQQVCIEKVEPMYGTINERDNVIMNEDIPCNESEDIFANATEHDERFFFVPKVIKD